jgi:hypothetical protein
MNISIDITPNRFTRKLGGIVEKTKERRIALRNKLNARYCMLRVRLAKK